MLHGSGGICFGIGTPEVRECDIHSVSNMLEPFVDVLSDVHASSDKLSDRKATNYANHEGEGDFFPVGRWALSGHMCWNFHKHLGGMDGALYCVVGGVSEHLYRPCM